jgi:hypothetical protein
MLALHAQHLRCRPPYVLESSRAAATASTGHADEDKISNVTFYLRLWSLEHVANFIAEEERFQLLLGLCPCVATAKQTFKHINYI